MKEKLKNIFTRFARWVKKFFSNRKNCMRFIFVVINVIVILMYLREYRYVPFSSYYDKFFTITLSYFDFLFKSSIVYFLAVIADAIVMRKKKSTVKKTEKKDVKPQESAERQNQSETLDKGAV